MDQLQWHHFVTILSQLSTFSPFCHHFMTILSQFMMRRKKLYRDDKLNQAIGEYYNGTKKFIAVTELVNFCLNIVESSFQMIIDTCEFAVPALYQLVKTLVFPFKLAFLVFSYLPIALRLRFQAQTGWFIMSHKVVTRKSRFFW